MGLLALAGLAYLLAIRRHVGATRDTVASAIPVL